MYKKIKARVGEFNLFLAHTPSNVRVCRDVIDNLQIPENECLLIYEGNVAEDIKGFARVIYFENPYINHGKIGRLFIKKKNTATLKLLLNKLQDVQNVYISDIAWYLNNYIFFHKRDVNFNLYTDGSLSDYRPIISNSSFIRSIARSLVDFSIFAIPYRPYLGKVAGEDRDKILKYFVYRKSYDSFSNKNHYLIKKTEYFTPDANSGLYIDACFLESELTDDEYSEYILEAFSYMRSLGCNNISAKPHPLSTRNILAQLCARTNSYLVQSKDVADVTISMLKPAIITSHLSTVLIEYATYHKELRAVSMLDDAMIKKLRNKKYVIGWIEAARNHGVIFPRLKDS